MPIVTRHEYDPADFLDQYVLAAQGDFGGPYLVDEGEEAPIRFRRTRNVRHARKFSLIADAMAFIDSDMGPDWGVGPVRVKTPVTATPAEMLD